MKVASLAEYADERKSKEKKLVKLRVELKGWDTTLEKSVVYRTLLF